MSGFRVDSVEETSRSLNPLVSFTPLQSPETPKSVMAFRNIPEDTLKKTKT